MMLATSRPIFYGGYEVITETKKGMDLLGIQYKFVSKIKNLKLPDQLSVCSNH
jgi:hypothetical protein